MKKWLVIGLFAILLGCHNRSTSKGYIPDDILDAFNNSYPEAEKVDWQSSDGYYQVKFRENGTMKTAFYQLDGTFVRVD